MTLGARWSEVAGMIVGQAAVYVIAGVIVGLAGAFAGTRLMTGLLTALAASTIPAIRAARTMPVPCCGRSSRAAYRADGQKRGVSSGRIRKNAFTA